MRQPAKLCPQPEFTRLLHELGMNMAYEVAKVLPTYRKMVDAERGGNKLDAMVLNLDNLVVIPILRSGIPMAEGFCKVLPAPKTGHIGIHVDKSTQKLTEYMISLPETENSESEIVILDPVIATGNTADRAISIVKEMKFSSIRFVSIIASYKGVKKLNYKHPDVSVFCAAVDPTLEEGSVIPGIGAVSERVFGFKTFVAEKS